MAKQIKGARANKPNDSFGVTNNPNLYKNKYREEVDRDDDDDEVQAQDPTEQVATQEESTSFAETKQSDEHDYKKRYDDLKKHYDSKLNEFKNEREQMSNEIQAIKDNMQRLPAGTPTPKSAEELQEFKEKYPDVFDVVETVSGMKTEQTVASLREEIQVVKEREKALKKEKAYEELMHTHPDFGELKTSEKLTEWLDDQPTQLVMVFTKTILMLNGQAKSYPFIKQRWAYLIKKLLNLAETMQQLRLLRLNQKTLQHQIKKERFGRCPTSPD